MVVVLSASAANCSALPSGKGCKYTGQAVRALPIRIISVGKKRSQGVQLVVDEYIQRLKLYCSVEDVHIKNNPKNASDWRAQVDHEDSAVMDLIRSDDWVVLMDERGKDIGSMQMAELIGDAGNTGASRLSFCVGGPYGHGKQLRERANISIKLSSMVMDHSKRAELSSLAFFRSVNSHIGKNVIFISRLEEHFFLMVWPNRYVQMFKNVKTEDQSSS